MAIQDGRVILALAIMFTLAVLLQLLGCVLWSNWWPMLTAFFYVLVPMPYLFFGGGSGGSLLSGSDLQSGWVDAGKFLTGFSAVGLVAVPAILAHANLISVGALVLELLAAVVIFAMVINYDYYSSRDLLY